MRSLPIAVAVLALAACRTENGAGDDATDGGPGVDASGVGCSMTSPRAVPPEAFVGPGGLQQRMTQLIDGAEDTLDISMYLWTVKPLAERVVAAKQRGVAVRVLLDPDSPGNDSVKPIFAAGGVNVRLSPTLYTFSHAKYLLIDGDTAVIMSMNFNVDAMNNERNYGMVNRDPDDVADVQAIFDQDWAMSGGEPPQPADLACTRLIVSPTNAQARIVDHINSAQDTLELQIMYLSETTVRDAIIAASQRGVTVRVIIEDPSDDAIPMLKAAGVSVKTSTNSYYLHAKLITADGVPFVGSENMSFTSLNKNREVGALVFEPSAAAVVTSQFESDWSVGPSL
ncbi:MAG: phosphatidylserine/phosphatidylglycerophosphate/cardiolipin synthase family protein [Kofleriaceae bacterium]